MKINTITPIYVFSLLLIGNFAGAAIGTQSLWFWPAYLLMLLGILYRFFSAFKKEAEPQSGFKGSLALLDNTWVFFMALGLFLCSGAEVSMSTGLVSWLKEEHLLSGFSLWIVWVMFLLSLFAGRMLLPLILRFMPARPLLLFSVLFFVAGIMMIIMGGLPMAISGILLSGLGLANIFAMISFLMLQRLPSHEKEIRGLMLLSVIGGAFLPPLLLWINYGGGTGLGFVVPLFNVLFVFFLALIAKQDTETV